MSVIGRTFYHQFLLYPASALRLQCLSHDTLLLLITTTSVTGLHNFFEIESLVGKISDITYIASSSFCCPSPKRCNFICWEATWHESTLQCHYVASHFILFPQGAVNLIVTHPSLRSRGIDFVYLSPFYILLLTRNVAFVFTIDYMIELPRGARCANWTS